MACHHGNFCNITPHFCSHPQCIDSFRILECRVVLDFNHTNYMCKNRLRLYEKHRKRRLSMALQTDLNQDPIWSFHLCGIDQQLPCLQAYNHFPSPFIPWKPNFSPKNICIPARSYLPHFITHTEILAVLLVALEGVQGDSPWANGVPETRSIAPQ